MAFYAKGWVFDLNLIGVIAIGNFSVNKHSSTKKETIVITSTYEV